MLDQYKPCVEDSSGSPCWRGWRGSTRLLRKHGRARVRTEAKAGRGSLPRRRRGVLPLANSPRLRRAEHVIASWLLLHAHVKLIVILAFLARAGFSLFRFFTAFVFFSSIQPVQKLSATRSVTGLLIRTDLRRSRGLTDIQTHTHKKKREKETKSSTSGKAVKAAKNEHHRHFPVCLKNGIIALTEMVRHLCVGR